MKHPVTRTHNDKAVVVDLVESIAAAQIAQKPYLFDLAASLLADSDVSGERTWVSKKLDKPTGNCDVIETTDTDSICYAQLLRSDVYVRFVKKRQLKLSTYLSIELFATPDGAYEIRQIVVGEPLPPVPGEPTADAAGREFWDTHALLWGDWPVKGKTMTKVCPWDTPTTP